MTFVKNVFSRPNYPVLRLDRREGGILHCPRCGAVHFRKAWHHENRELRALRCSGTISVHETICPACAMVRAHASDGRLIIANIPTHIRPNIVNLISGYCTRSWAQNPESRLVEMFASKDRLVVMTTEPQLAVGVAKKIRDAYKRVDLDIHYAPRRTEETKVYLRFLQQAEGTAA